ncbi:MAG TPA: ATP-binding protein [Candidatus Bathyarchaeia archaeon]|nr:ATP-binding protein [Candidatus Bathyarchaeia archaeon]
MRTFLQIAIISISFFYIMVAIGFVLLVESNKLELIGKLTKETEILFNGNQQLVYFDIFVLTVVIGIFVFFVVRSVTNPLRKLRYAADKIARGYLDVKIPTRGTDEVRDLAHSLQAMVNAIRKEKALQSAALQKYRNLYETSSNLYRTVNLDGIITNCNRLFAERLGYTVLEVIGTHYNKYTAPKDVQTMNESFKNWKEKGFLKDVEIWLKSRDGTIFPTLISTSNLYDENDNLIGCNEVIRDISEIYEARKKLEQDAILQIQLYETKKVDKLKNEFSSMMTHELKTPLVPIMGNCEMLKEPGLLGDLNQDQTDSVDMIYQNAARLEKLIGDILLAQRLEIGQITYDKQRFSVTKLMNEIEDDYSQIMKVKQIKFVNLTPEDLSLWSDKSRIRQVIDNLIQNAVDFTPQNDGRIEICAKNEDNKIFFSVRDNGMGIPKEIQPVMFKKFYQVDASHRRKHTGTGLGLVTSKGIVEGLGGEIWFESEPGKSTIFYFNIPQEVLYRNRIA